MPHDLLTPVELPRVRVDVESDPGHGGTRGRTVAVLAAEFSDQRVEILVVESGFQDDRMVWFRLLHGLRQCGVRRVGVVQGPDDRAVRIAVETMFPAARFEAAGEFPAPC